MALGFQSFFNSVKVDSSGWVFAVLGVEPVYPSVSYSVISYWPLLSGNVSPSTTLTSTALTQAGSLSLH